MSSSASNELSVNHRCGVAMNGERLTVFPPAVNFPKQSLPLVLLDLSSYSKALGNCTTAAHQPDHRPKQNGLCSAHLLQPYCILYSLFMGCSSRASRPTANARSATFYGACHGAPSRSRQESEPTTHNCETRKGHGLWRKIFLS
jgi:hypothetical protein